MGGSIEGLVKNYLREPGSIWSGQGGLGVSPNLISPNWTIGQLTPKSIAELQQMYYDKNGRLRENPVYAISDFNNASEIPKLRDVHFDEEGNYIIESKSDSPVNVVPLPLVRTPEGNLLYIPSERFTPLQNIFARFLASQVPPLVDLGLIGSLVHGFKENYQQTNYLINNFGKAVFGRKTLRDVENGYYELKKEHERFLSEGFWETTLRATGGIAGYMAAQYKKAIAPTIVGAAAGAGIGAVSSGIGALPGALIGGRIGLKSSQLVTSYLANTAYLYMKLREEGIPEADAFQLSVYTGIPLAAIDMMQFATLEKAISGRTLAGSKLTNAAARVLAQMVYNTGIQTAQEVAQRGISETASMLAHDLAQTRLEAARSEPARDVYDILSRMFEEFYQTITPMGIFSLVGVPGGVIRAMADERVMSAHRRLTANLDWDEYLKYARTVGEIRSNIRTGAVEPKAVVPPGAIKAYEYYFSKQIDQARLENSYIELMADLADRLEKLKVPDEAAHTREIIDEFINWQRVRTTPFWLAWLQANAEEGTDWWTEFVKNARDAESPLFPYLIGLAKHHNPAWLAAHPELTVLQRPQGVPFILSETRPTFGELIMPFKDFAASQNVNFKPKIVSIQQWFQDAKSREAANDLLSVAAWYIKQGKDIPDKAFTDYGFAPPSYNKVEYIKEIQKARRQYFASRAAKLIKLLRQKLPVDLSEWSNLNLPSPVHIQFILENNIFTEDELVEFVERGATVAEIEQAAEEKFRIKLEEERNPPIYIDLEGKYKDKHGTTIKINDRYRRVYSLDQVIESIESGKPIITVPTDASRQAFISANLDVLNRHAREKILSRLRRILAQKEQEAAAQQQELQTAVQQQEAVTEQPAEQQTIQPPEQLQEQPVQPSIVQPAEQVAEQQPVPTTEQVAEQPVEQPVEQPAEQQTEQSQEQSTQLEQPQPEPIPFGLTKEDLSLPVRFDNNLTEPKIIMTRAGNRELRMSAETFMELFPNDAEQIAREYSPDLTRRSMNRLLKAYKILAYSGETRPLDEETQLALTKIQQLFKLKRIADAVQAAKVNDYLAQQESASNIQLFIESAADIGQSEATKAAADYVNARLESGDNTVHSDEEVKYTSDRRVPYLFKVRYVSLDDLIPSHSPKDFSPNPKYPKSLQPRMRDKASSQANVMAMAGAFNPDEVLLPHQSITSGSPIIDADSNVVISGNGRVLTLFMVRQHHPEKWAEYQRKLVESAQKIGISPEALPKDAVRVLVPAFPTTTDVITDLARIANVAPVETMSEFEVAVSLADRVDDGIIMNLNFNIEKDTIEDALTRESNRPLIRAILSRLTPSELAKYIDEDGNLSPEGMLLVQNVILIKALGRDNAEKLRNVLISAAPEATVLKRVVWYSLPSIAAGESFLSTVNIPDASIVTDFANAINGYFEAAKKNTNPLIEDLPTLEGAHHQTGLERVMLRLLMLGKTSHKPIVNTVTEYYSRMLNFSPEQQALFGEAKFDKVEQFISSIPAEYLARIKDELPSLLRELAPSGEVAERITQGIDTEYVEQAIQKTEEQQRQAEQAEQPLFQQQQPNQVQPAQPEQAAQAEQPAQSESGVQEQPVEQQSTEPQKRGRKPIVREPVTVPARTKSGKIPVIQVDKNHPYYRFYTELGRTKIIKDTNQNEYLYIVATPVQHKGESVERVSLANRDLRAIAKFVLPGDKLYRTLVRVGDKFVIPGDILSGKLKNSIFEIKVPDEIVQANESEYTETEYRKAGGYIPESQETVVIEPVDTTLTEQDLDKLVSKLKDVSKQIRAQQRKPKRIKPDVSDAIVKSVEEDAVTTDDTTKSKLTDAIKDASESMSPEQSAEARDALDKADASRVTDQAANLAGDQTQPESSQDPLQAASESIINDDLGDQAKQEQPEGPKSKKRQRKPRPKPQQGDMLFSFTDPVSFAIWGLPSAVKSIVSALKYIYRAVKGSYRPFLRESSRLFKTVSRSILEALKESYHAIKRHYDGLRIFKANLGLSQQQYQQPIWARYVSNQSAQSVSVRLQTVNAANQLNSILTDPDLLTSDKVLHKIIRWYNKWFTSKGVLPKEVKRAFDARDIALAAANIFAKRQLNKFRDVVEQEYGQKLNELPESFITVLFDAFRGDQNALVTLRPKTRDAILNLRNTLDSYSEKLLDLPFLTDEERQVIQDQLGTYGHRSYAIFTLGDKWTRYVLKYHPEWVQDVRQFLKSQLPNATPEQIEQLVDKLTNIHKLYDSYLTVLTKAAKAGRMDLTPLIERKDVPEPIRRLWGEFKDPSIVFYDSITHIANIIENFKFAQILAEHGLANGYISDTFSSKTPYKIAGLQNRALYPLEGLFTTKDVIDAISLASYMAHSRWYQWYMKLWGFTKWGKVVGSPKTMIRGFLSSGIQALSNGYIGLGLLRDTAKLAGLELDTSLHQYTRHLIENLSNPAQIEAMFNELVQLGVIADQNIAKDMLEHLRSGGWIAELAEPLIKGDNPFEKLHNMLGSVMKSTSDIYALTDDFWKIYAFLHEVNDYAKAYPDKSIAEIKQIAANHVRAVMQTYSQLPLWVRKLRSFPILGTFPAFTAEIVRNTKNTILIAAEELKQPNTRHIGLRRLASLLAAIVAIQTASTATRLLFGISDDEDKALRKFLPSWSKFGVLLYLSPVVNGTVQFIDLSYSIPYSVFLTPIIAALKGDSIADVKDALLQVTEPFYSTNLVLETILEIIAGETTGKRTLFEKPEPLSTKVYEATKFFVSKLQPGLFSDLNRIFQGIASPNTPSGKLYNPILEFAAMCTGQRAVKANIEQALHFFAKQHLETLQAADRTLLRKLRDRRFVAPISIRRQLDNALNIKHVNTNYMTSIINAAKTLHIPHNRIVSILKENRIPNYQIQNLIHNSNNQYIQISNKTIQNMINILGYNETINRLHTLYH